MWWNKCEQNKFIIKITALKFSLGKKMLKVVKNIKNLRKRPKKTIKTIEDMMNKVFDEL